MTIEEIRNARQSARIASMDDLALRAGTQEIMMEAMAMNGRDDTLATRFSPLLSQKLRVEFGSLTLDEVQLAFRAGTEEEFGKNYTITYATLLIWLRGYVSDRRVALVRGEELEKDKRARRASVPRLTRAQTAERVRRGNVEVLRHRWRDVVEGVASFEVPEAGALAFDYLADLGLVEPDPARRRTAESLAEIETPHPFVASVGRSSTAEAREAAVKNIELRLFLRDLRDRGGELRLPAVDDDMPSYF